MLTKTFKQLSSKDVAIAGGKGASLGEMTMAKMPVPPGFVILAAAFNLFLAETVHPVTRDKNQMIIEAGWGLGEAIVSGQITPDAYVIDKRDLSIIDINIAKQEMMIIRKAGGGVKRAVVPMAKQEKQKLSGRQIIELAKICLAIEKHYKKPQDIEWALAKGKFYITQSRPITTL